MTVPFDGWDIFPDHVALGRSAIINAKKDALASTAVLTADAAQVAKVLGKGVAGYALSVAVEQLLGAVDWVLDPANNQIKYKPKIESQYIYTPAAWGNGTYFSTPQQACEYSLSLIQKMRPDIGYSSVSLDDKDCIYVSPYGVERLLYVKKVNPDYDGNSEKYLSLETVAQKVIENADAGSLDAQVATMAAAAEKLADAANDEEIEQAIVDQLENNAKCPSGIMSEKGQCWECTKEDYPVITQRTKLAKVETARLGKCLPEMDNTALFIRINAFNEFVQARVNENSCWAPLDPGHVQQEQDGRNGALKCTNYLK
ncbi:hypothetical protein C3F34_14195 [Acinetobacter sp. ACNIH2]|uniref:hypothetical protein n=1 Tax=Acinetobacter sp. ACNIH2 TaxID=1758189 RepID=UPI000CDC2538|nr:hypothetical protein [Acinetobacter sp. ACNIH2]AUX87073.1 hypothetical protein C3F34_14195 [Acinetobacter sp. ACNIH2]